MLSPLETVANEIKKLEDFCLAQNDMPYGELYDIVETKLQKIKEYAKEYNVPLVIEAVHILSKYGHIEESVSHAHESYYDEVDYYESYYDESNY